MRSDDPGGTPHARGTGQQIVDVVLHFNARFDAHTKEEMERYAEILDRLDQNHNASEVRHHKTETRLGALMQSITAFSEQERNYHDNPCPQLISALPDADFTGHRRAHEALIKAAEDTGDLLRHIKKTVVTAAVISVGGWLLLAVWAQFLKGPA